MSTDSTVHVVAVVKGAMEDDPHKHFGSLLGFEEHLATAVAAGLVNAHARPTPRGASFYFRHGLASLPAGRANYWDADRLYDAASEIDQFSRA